MGDSLYTFKKTGRKFNRCLEFLSHRQYACDHCLFCKSHRKEKKLWRYWWKQILSLSQKNISFVFVSLVLELPYLWVEFFRWFRNIPSQSSELVGLTLFSCRKSFPSPLQLFLQCTVDILNCQLPGKNTVSQKVLLLKGAQAWPSWVWVFLHKADPYG